MTWYPPTDPLSAARSLLAPGLIAPGWRLAPDDANICLSGPGYNSDRTVALETGTEWWRLQLRAYPPTELSPVNVPFIPRAGGRSPIRAQVISILREVVALESEPRGWNQLSPLERLLSACGWLVYRRDGEPAVDPTLQVRLPGGSRVYLKPAWAGINCNLKPSGDGPDERSERLPLDVPLWLHAQLTEQP